MLSDADGLDDVEHLMQYVCLSRISFVSSSLKWIPLLPSF